MRMLNPVAALITLVLCVDVTPGVAAESALQAAVERGAETSATLDNNVVRIGWQRDDVPVRIDGTAFPPAAGLGSWAAFQSDGAHVMVMGDTVVFEDEITPAMDAAFDNGLDVTALHNHFIYDDPPVYFMHIGGQGDAEELAGGVRAMWDAIRSLRADRPVPRRNSDGGDLGQGDLDVAGLEGILKEQAAVNGDVVKFTIAREGVMHGRKIGGAMGLTTWAAFIGDDQAAAVDGDFLMTAEEVQPVLRALRRNGIHIVALHNHMIGESPTAYFLHYWGRGSAQALAAGLREALEIQEQ